MLLSKPNDPLWISVGSASLNWYCSNVLSCIVLYCGIVTEWLYSRPQGCPSFSPDVFSTDVCGPDKEFDMETCQCVCQRNVPTNNCGPHHHLDLNTCQCVCNTLPASSCPPNHVFNKESCQCVCTRTCPRHQPLNKTKCSCECNESPKKCFLKGKRFHRATCRYQLNLYLSHIGLWLYFTFGPI